MFSLSVCRAAHRIKAPKIMNTPSWSVSLNTASLRPVRSRSSNLIPVPPHVTAVDHHQGRFVGDLATILFGDIDAKESGRADFSESPSCTSFISGAIHHLDGRADQRLRSIEIWSKTPHPTNSAVATEPANPGLMGTPSSSD